MKISSNCNFVFNLLNNPTNKIAVLRKEKSLINLLNEKIVNDLENFKIIDLKNLSQQKLCSYYESERLVVISLNPENKINKIYHTSKKDKEIKSTRSLDFEALDVFDYFSLFGYCLEKIGAENIDLPKTEKISLVKTKIRKVNFDHLKKQKLNQKESFLLQMMMKYQNIVKKQIEVFLDSIEEEQKRKKEDEKIKEKIRAQILYEIRQAALKKDEIEKDEKLKLLKSEVI